MIFKSKFILSLSLVAIAGVALQPALAHSGEDHPSQDSEETTLDSNLDSDGDGYADCIEKGRYRDDADNDGVDDDEDDTVSSLQTLTDNDADGIPDYIEKSEYRRNHDNTGKHDPEDLDDDDDGLRDRNEDADQKKDHDNTGKGDKRDLDDDNDGIEDLDEVSCGQMFDHDNDDDKDRSDSDDDNDGVEDDEDEYQYDHDNDGSDDQDDANDDDGGEDDVADAYEVEIEDSAFAPADLTIQVGESITFTNKDSSVHTATAVHGEFNTGSIEADESVTITFEEAGSFDYYCFFHESMTGTITVEAAD